MLGKVREEVVQEVVDAMGAGSEAQVEHAWRGWLGAWPGCLLLWDPKIPAGGWVERLLFLDGGQRLWEEGGNDGRGFRTVLPSPMVFWAMQGFDSTLLGGWTRGWRYL